MKKKEGLSLVVLVITIIIIITLSSVAIFNVKDQNTIDKSKKVVLKDDLLTFKTDFDAYVDNKRFEAIAEGQYYIPENDDALKHIDKWDKVKEIIPSMLKDYDNIIIIQNGKLTYNGDDRSEETIKMLNDIGIQIK